MSTPDTLTEEERLELELAEQARQNSGDWDSVKPGKANDFGKSFGRLIGLLRPHAVAFTFVSILGAIGVVLAVIAPKLLGEATNIIFEGAVSNALAEQFPAGTSQEQVVTALRGAGQTDIANIVGRHERLRGRRRCRLRGAPHGDRRRARDLRGVVVPELDPGLRDQHHHGAHDVAPA